MKALCITVLLFLIVDFSETFIVNDMPYGRTSISPDRLLVTDQTTATESININERVSFGLSFYKDTSIGI